MDPMEGIGQFEYNTKDLIGHGAFAVVFKGRHKTTKELVAIKSITKKNLAKSQNLLGKEIKILKELTALHHENVVALLDCKETTHHVYLVMEYCNGGDLADYLHSKGTLSEDTIRLFLRQIAGAMEALNAKGIVHRDLKPQNILLCHSGKSGPSPSDITLKIADFGFARFLQDGVMAATLCGSPMYMAPEVIMSMQYDAKADLWSIGTIVFQCLTGKAPFQAQTPQALKQFYEKNANLAPKIPSDTSNELTDLLLKLLKRNSVDRMDFDDFFAHPFLKPLSRLSSPVPVPPRRSEQQSPISVSPSGAPKWREMQVDGRPPRVNSGGTLPSPDDQDFVMVPEGLPTYETPRWPQEEPKVLVGPVSCSPVLEENGVELGSLSPHQQQQQQRPLSEPIPVPTQREAYQQIQRSLMDDSPVSTSPSAAAIATTTNINKPSWSPLQGSGHSDKVRAATDVASLSPPTVQFAMGTPPGRRMSGGTPPSAWHLPQQQQHLSRRQNSVPLSSSPLPNIPLHEHPNGNTWEEEQVAAFGPPSGSPEPNRNLRGSSPHLGATSRALTSPEFHNWPVGQDTIETDGYASELQRVSSLRMCGQIPAASRQSCTLLGMSPPNMEGAITFVAPELPEETLMEKEHNETLAKLHFVSALVDCILELARSRTELTESILSRRDTGTGGGVFGDATQQQRQGEQLVLYMKALQLLSSSLQLSRREVQGGRLQASASVRTVLHGMKDRFHMCLDHCKTLHSANLLSNSDSQCPTANRLIYNYAIEMCQSAAMKELLGNPEECFHHYQTAQILLHSLSQQVDNEDDRRLLNRYKDAVEKRLFVLQSQGIVCAYDSS